MGDFCGDREWLLQAGCKRQLHPGADHRLLPRCRLLTNVRQSFSFKALPLAVLRISPSSQDSIVIHMYGFASGAEPATCRILGGSSKRDAGAP